MNRWLLGAVGFMNGMKRDAQKGRAKLRLSRPISETQEMLVARRRAEYAKELLSSEVVQEAIQFMNEHIVEEIAATNPLDNNRLVMLRLRLETVSEFPQVLAQFVDSYSEMLSIRQQYAARRNAYLEQPEGGTDV